MVFEAPGATRGLWDQFQARNVAFSGTLPFDDAILRAKRAPDERRYLLLMQRNPKLREAILNATY